LTSTMLPGSSRSQTSAASLGNWVYACWGSIGLRLAIHRAESRAWSAP
jgi:hypothetical protein